MIGIHPIVVSYDHVRCGDMLQSPDQGMVVLAEGGIVHAVALEDDLPGFRFRVRWLNYPQWALEIINNPMAMFPLT